MCGRFVQRDLAAFERHFEIKRSPGWRPSYNVAPSQPVAIVRREPESGAVALTEARWGFVPAWVADTAKWPKPINGRVETLFEKPTWRTPIRRSRCLIPADGWYEWQPVEGRKQPHYIEPKAHAALAGVWERFGRGDEAMDTFAVLVGPAPCAVSAVHDRAPIALSETDWSAWLEPGIGDAEIKGLLARECPPLRHWPVSVRVNRPQNNDPELLNCIQI
jgi:putative SOS response-associated peptidase YedK